MNKDILIKVLRRSVIIMIVILILSLFLLSDYKPFIYGLIFGVLIGLVAFKELYNTVNKSVYMHPEDAVSYSKKHYFIRYIMYFIVLSISALADYLYFPATLLGLVIPKITIYLSAIFDKEFL